MTTNLEAAIAVLRHHRGAQGRGEAVGWTDETVAAELMTELGLKPDGVARHARAVVDELADMEREDVERADAERLAALKEASEAQRGRGSRLLADPSGGVKEPITEHQAGQRKPGREA